MNFSFADENKSLTILAPENITLAIAVIAKEYSKEYNAELTINFNNISSHITNIEEGVAADLIITDHFEWIKTLKQKGLVNISSIRYVLEDKLVLITSTKSDKILKNFKNNKKSLYQKQDILIPAREKNLTGIYVYQIFENHKFFKKRLGKNIENPNIIAKITKTPNLIGITAYSRVYDNQNIKILEIFDNNLHEEFLYQIAIVAGAKIKESKKFIKYLRNHNNQKIFKQYGFSLIE